MSAIEWLEVGNYMPSMAQLVLIACDKGAVIGKVTNTGWKTKEGMPIYGVTHFAPITLPDGHVFR